MTIGQLFRAHLLGDPAIAAVVVARVYPIRLPQKATYPAITYRRVSGVRANVLKGPASLARPRMQVDSWGLTHDDATALGGLVRQRLENYVGTWSDGGSPAVTIAVAIEFENEIDLFEEDIDGGLCRHSADYFVSYGTNGGAM